MKLGLFGGTFDPIHFGHLNLAFELMEKKKLDQVWFIPAKLNPFKAQSNSTSYYIFFILILTSLLGIYTFYKS